MGNVKLRICNRYYTPIKLGDKRHFVYTSISKEKKKEDPLTLGWNISNIYDFQLLPSNRVCVKHFI